MLNSDIMTSSVVEASWNVMAHARN